MIVLIFFVSEPPVTSLFVMNLKYKCLILDHDDTAVDSTASIHYPAHQEIMRRIRPGSIPISLEGWFKKNFHPGIMEYLVEELKFTEDELEQELAIWRDFTHNRTPRFYPGFIEMLQEYKSRGGIVTVVSHSEVEIIEAHYQQTDRNGTLFPELIFGWTFDAEKRKPNSYPVRQILQKFDLKEDEVLIVDDLKPGVEMAKASGVPIAAAGWGHQIPEVRAYMEANCLAYLSEIDEMRELVLLSSDF
ncbi:MAG: HAD family hydrolase [Deltaproteobacteria bacterium]|nr:HAD family hydrolase [Deltaproteobacteria bacterium]MBT4263668.1 HAD family hydrolase [Deltaproteobacteria bacterium]MBT4644511.1 HAD family hydrolase [Deltaproteobacteria bacterium]MBT6500532.1 HAD family hydrolase [Deltaproteobacteria bacterium]MBT6611860.1 HAD family hydrolase [Deltaproteobacteria bacterium]